MFHIVWKARVISFKQTLCSERMEKQRQLGDGPCFPAVTEAAAQVSHVSPGGGVSRTWTELLLCAGCVLSISTYYFI